MKNKDNIFLAKAALILFLGGITIPFLIAIFTDVEIAIGFGVISELLALIIRLISWKHTFGKIAAIGVGSLLFLSGINFVIYTKANARADSAERDVMHAEQQEAEQDGGINSESLRSSP